MLGGLQCSSKLPDVPRMAAGGAHRTYGAYFPDLASNMLGSFVMGILTSASALKAESARAIAILPEDHAWQVDALSDNSHRTLQQSWREASHKETMLKPSMQVVCHDSL